MKKLHLWSHALIDLCTYRLLDLKTYGLMLMKSSILNDNDDKYDINDKMTTMSLNVLKMILI